MNLDKEVLINDENFKDYDIVLSSRVRLARNLADFPFPNKLKGEEARKLNNRVELVLRNLKEKRGFEIIKLNALKPINLKNLQEMNLLEPAYHYKRDKPVIINRDSAITARIGDSEHLRLASYGTGLSLKDLYYQLDDLDNELENHIDYACSLEWGYHCSSIVTLGTGLKASIILHLPGLNVTSLIADIIDSLTNKDIVIKEFYTDKEGSFGHLYQISNLLSYDRNEKEIIERLTGVVKPILNMERQSRNELLNNNKTEFEDKIFRAQGILKHCRLISFRETMEHLSFLRMGICGGIVDDLSLEKITPLFFLLEDSHIKRLVKKLNLSEKGEKFIKKTRAKMVRDILHNE